VAKHLLTRVDITEEEQPLERGLSGMRKTLPAALVMTTGGASALPGQPGHEVWRFLLHPVRYYAMNVLPDGKY